MFELKLNGKVNPLTKNSSLDLNEFVRTSIHSSQDYSQIRGMISTNQTLNWTREISADELEDDNIEQPFAWKLKYLVRLVSHTGEYIRFKIHPEDLTKISMWKENDKFSFNITQPWLFEPQYWKKESTFRKEDIEEVIIIKDIPPLLTTEEKDVLEEKVDIAGEIRNAIMYFKIVELICMNSGSYQFFSSLRSL